MFLKIHTFSTGVVLRLQAVRRKYFLILQEKTWTGAQAYCRANYDDLATIEGWADLTEIQSEAEKQQFSSYAWIGLYTNTSAWRWSLGNKSLGYMTDWYRKVPWQEPNNANGNEECCAFCPEGWFDRSCWEEFAFVCFDGEEDFTLILCLVRRKGCTTAGSLILSATKFYKLFVTFCARGKRWTADLCKFTNV